ncbi:MAG: DUF962 domain-containing protein, partial [Myxococcales bacterium]|nr:DUF962 domain-containing protein [Myxococcales bacterium]
GREALLTLLEPPTWFGEISIFDGAPRTHDAIAECEALVLHVPRAALDTILSAQPRYWRELGLLVTSKLRLAFSAMEDMALLPLALRLARRLSLMAEGYGEREHQRRTVENRVQAVGVVAAREQSLARADAAQLGAVDEPLLQVVRQRREPAPAAQQLAVIARASGGHDSRFRPIPRMCQAADSQRAPCAASYEHRRRSRTMKSLEQQLTKYAAYHRDRRNIATHFAGIPMIVFASSTLLSRPLSGALGGVALSPALVATVATVVFYLALDLRYGLAMAAFMGASWWTGAAVAAHSTALWLSFGLGLFVAGWAMQLIGHAFEGKKPAFVDDLVGLLIGPLFIVAEAGFALGLRDDVREAIEQQVGPTLIRTAAARVSAR